MISVVICANALSIESVYFELSTYQLFLVLTFDKNLSSVVQNQDATENYNSNFEV